MCVRIYLQAVYRSATWLLVIAWLNTCIAWLLCYCQHTTAQEGFAGEVRCASRTVVGEVTAISHMRLRLETNCHREGVAPFQPAFTSVCTSAKDSSAVS